MMLFVVVQSLHTEQETGSITSWNNFCEKKKKKTYFIVYSL